MCRFNFLLFHIFDGRYLYAQMMRLDLNGFFVWKYAEKINKHLKQIDQIRQ